MRRVGLVLAGLGTCLIVFALLMPTWVSSQVVKFPLNIYVSVNLTDSNASYFSAAKLAEQTGVSVEATQTIKGNAAAGSSSTAVWNQFTYVYDQTNKQPIQSATRTFAFDRKTAQLVNCCGANVNGDSSVQQTGYVGIVLPIGTEKKTYPVFIPDVKKAVPFNYDGIDAVGGTEAYRFVGNIPPTQNGTQTLPGSLVNQSAASVTLPQYFQARITYWIDPVTGALLNVTENQKLTLRDSSGAQALLLFDAHLVATTDSVDRLLAIDNDQLSKQSFVNTLLPLVSGIVGAILLVVGILMARRPREGVEAGPSARSPELAAAASADQADRSATQASLVPGLDDEPRAAVAEMSAEEAKTEAAAPQAAHAEAADAEAAHAEAAQTEAAQTEAAQTEAAQTEAAKAGTEAAKPEAEATQALQAESSAEAAKAEAAPEPDAGPAPAESPAAEARADEAPTAEMSAATDETAADGAGDSPASNNRRGRGGAHRR